MIVALGDLQRVWRSKQSAARRNALREYLINGTAPSAAAFRLVAQRLYCDGLIDNIGLADLWLATATTSERAALFSAIATGLLG